MPEEKEMVTMDIEIPDDQYKELQAMAEKLNITAEELMSTLLVEYVERETEKSNKEKRDV